MNKECIIKNKLKQINKSPLNGEIITDLAIVKIKCVTNSY